MDTWTICYYWVTSENSLRLSGPDHICNSTASEFALWGPFGWSSQQHSLTSGASAGGLRGPGFRKSPAVGLLGTRFFCLYLTFLVDL